MATVRIPARRERWAEASAPAPTRSASELIYSAGSRFARAICATAERIGADLIIMGSREHGAAPVGNPGSRMLRTARHRCNHPARDELEILALATMPIGALELLLKALFSCTQLIVIESARKWHRDLG